MADRRKTPLAFEFVDRIRRAGPMTVDEYMQACLYDPEHGTYRTSTAIGALGHFITAPEISQVFGELLGAWTAVVWQQMGRPQPCNLVELGPGRGTLMQDALRALSAVPAALAAMRVHMVEPSEPLAAIQRAALASVSVPTTWHTRLRDVPRVPTILLANEVLDAQPISQAVWTAGGWRMRGVGLNDAGQLEFVVLAENQEREGHALGLDSRVPHPRSPPAPDLIRSSPWTQNLSEGQGTPQSGDILEIGHCEDIMDDLASLAGDALAALFIDYGHTRTDVGDTLQAVRRHAYEHPLCSPGEADLTAQVDFEQVARAVQSRGLASDGPIPQAEFLGALGAAERTSRLMAANPDQAADLEAGTARLMAPSGMGTRYKVLGVRSPRLPVLPGFPR